ncbi:hypothetical protein [Chelatococcus reniformis]|uniref:Uncharacterized protein n=1 Tax=Chelatococcus reniformis TaxID=1494448 RepID=A0A916U133_9HYPH|nr:hypothetical protein [Chelatococcus reniformis]GGC54436.1 hypothetical protein GCM10010994_11750 [Chelatococcus reniformis]
MSDITDQSGSGRRSFLLAQAPYIAMLLLVFGGIALTSLLPSLTSVYWQLIAVVFAVMCILSEWRRHPPGRPRWRMAIAQLLHWAVILIAMRVLFVHDVANMLNSDAIGLAVLAVLALGTLLAGIHIGAWQIGFVGLLLALGIPAIAWLEQAALLITAAAISIAAIAALYLWQRHRSAESADV